eukprot:768230-Hanusia_phi.AAC.6
MIAYRSYFSSKHFPNSFHPDRNCPRCRKCYPPIVIFPEVSGGQKGQYVSEAQGTTTNGLGMLTFRTGAFVSSIPVGCLRQGTRDLTRLIQVSPVCIRFASSRRFNACWETIPFSLHLFRAIARLVPS